MKLYNLSNQSMAFFKLILWCSIVWIKVAFETQMLRVPYSMVEERRDKNFMLTALVLRNFSDEPPRNQKAKRQQKRICKI